LLAPLIAMFLYGSGHILSQQIWSQAGLRRFEHYTAAFAAISAGLGLFLRRYFFPSLLAIILICSAAAVGPVAIAAALFFVFSSTVLGRLLFGRSLEGPLAFFGGMAIWILAMNFTVRIPIHYAAVYLVALALPVAIGWTHSRRLAAQWLDLFRPVHKFSVADSFSFALLAFVMVAYWLLVLKPEVSADGLAMHLAIASNIALHHAFTIDFRQTYWALMPMGGDWAYSIAYMLGGEYAARLLNLAMLTAIAVLLFRAAQRFVSKAVAMVMVFLFVSTPMVQHVTTSMFVENFVAAMTLGALVALWKYYEEGTAQSLILTALLLGTSVALKLVGLAIAAVFVPLFVILMLRKQSPSAVTRICAVGILLAIGVMPYAYAYRQSGNPIFPFNNARFHSPYVENDIVDNRFQHPLSWRTPLQLTLDTHLYYEGQDGSFGFQYFLFLPLTLICLIPMRSFAGSSAAVIGLGAALVISAIQPNARYFYPALPLLTLGATAALSYLWTSRRSLFLACLVAAVLAGVGNTYLLPSSNWYHKHFYSAPVFSASGRQTYLREVAPIREAIHYLNGFDRAQPIAFMDSSLIAGLIAPAYTNTWHGYPFLKQMRAVHSPEKVYGLLSRLGVRHLIVEPNENREKSVRDFLTVCGETKYSLAGTSVVSILPDCESRLRLWVSTPLPAGNHDDTEMKLSGDWIQAKNLPSAYQQGVSYSDDPEASVRFTFTGRGFRYGYTKAFNRGMAEILIDGSQKSVVDLYSAKAEWQAQTTIDDLSPSLHDVTIRVLHEKHPDATGYFIDIDFVEIF
jgi:hypothetical protein